MSIVNKITFSEAAEELGITRQYVHKLVKQLDITPEKRTPRLNLLTKTQVAKIRRHLTSIREKE